MAEERSGVALGTHPQERAGIGSDDISLDGWGHENHDGDDVAALDAPPEDRFGDAVLAHHEQLARFAFMLSGSREVAEASVAETYARLWPRFRRGRIDNVLPHLIREVIVDVKERTRHAGRHPGAPGTADDLHTPWAALQRLPLEQRSALVLHVVAGFGLDESAALLGEPLDVTTTRIDVGLGRIATLLVTSRSDA